MFIGTKATYFFIISEETDLSLKFTTWSKNALEFV